MIKRLRLLFAVLMVFAFVAAACGSDDTDDSAVDDTTSDTEATEETTADTTADDDDEVMVDEPAAETLLIWADESRVEPLQAIAPAFTEATGVEVEVQLVPFGEIRDQVTQAGPAGEGPDIFAGAHDWTGELAANGTISAIDLGPSASSFLATALNGFNFEGENYAVPYVTEAVALYRNTDLAPDAPATWDDLLAACATAAAEECLVLPGGGTATDAYHTYPLISGFGGYIFGFDAASGFDTTDVGLDSPEALEGAAFLAEQVEAGTVASTDYDTAKNLWLEGSAPFWITGPWELGGTRETDMNFDVSIIPEYGDQATQPFVGAQGFYLSSFSENTLLAQSFLLDFIATDATMQALYDADPRGTAWKSVADQLDSDPQVQAFAASAANGISMPNVPEMAAVWGPLGDNLLLVRNDEVASDEAMTTAAEAVRAAVSG